MLLSEDHRAVQDAVRRATKISPAAQPGTSSGITGRPMSRRMDSRFSRISAPMPRIEV